MSILNKNYVMSDNPVLPISWDEYETKSLREYSALINEKSTTEAKMQVFFEKNPSFLPGAFGVFGESGHFPLNNSLISQPKLCGYRSKIPDFLWIAFDSCTVYLNFIEIEKPNKNWFTKEGHQTAEFSKGYNQLLDWEVWFSNDSNKRNFLSEYGISLINNKLIDMNYILIYGRSSEMVNNNDLNKKRCKMRTQNILLMTYDRLTPNKKGDCLITSKVVNGKFIAKYVTPTFQLGPLLADTYINVSGKKKAIDQSDISEERKTFLKNRIEYWEEFGRSNISIMSNEKE